MSGIEITEDGKTTIFTINRQQVKNALNVEATEALRVGFEAFDRSDQRVAIITGAGKHFSGGADLNDVPPIWKAYPTLGLRTDKPVICAVNGACNGGGFVLATFADLCVASENATFWYPEGQIGATAGGIATLAGRIPHKFAMEVMLLGRQVPAQRAYEMGFVNQVTPTGEALNVALTMAREIEVQAPLVLKLLKRFVTEHTLIQSPSERMWRTQQDLEIVSRSEDRARGIAAFFADELPVEFTGQ